MGQAVCLNSGCRPLPALCTGDPKVNAGSFISPGLSQEGGHVTEVPESLLLQAASLCRRPGASTHKTLSAKSPRRKPSSHSYLPGGCLGKGPNLYREGRGSCFLYSLSFWLLCTPASSHTLLIYLAVHDPSQLAYKAPFLHA